MKTEFLAAFGVATALAAPAAAMHAVAAPNPTSSPTPTTATDAAKPASPFVQCDGMVGHVSGGARLGRLLLVMGTAGLSEAGMNRDDASKRATGAAGVAACDEALAKEGDAYRRAQLFLARAVHFGEDGKWDEAAAAARLVPTLLGARTGDWGLSSSVTGVARYFEALYLTRAGKLGAAEDAAWSGVAADRYNVLTLSRMNAFGALSRTIGPDKRAALRAIVQLFPQVTADVAALFAGSGDDATAVRLIDGFDGSFRAFIAADKIGKFEGSLDNRRATYLALSGDVAGAQAAVARSDAWLEAERGRGASAKNPTSFATAEDWTAFAHAALLSAQGRNGEAGELLANRGNWAAIPPLVLARLVGKVAPGVPARERRGVLATGEEELARKAIAARRAALSDGDDDKKLFGMILLNQDVELSRLAAQAQTGSANAKWLVKPGKEPRSYDILSNSERFAGVSAGEGLLLHAALIAKARGKAGFVVAPARTDMTIMGVRFVDPGELNIPALSMVDAGAVIADLGPHIRVAS